MTIYIDLILIENIIMNYIIVLSTSFICKTKTNVLRFLIASVLGSIYAILLYTSSIFLYNNQISKFLLSVLIVYISFNPKNIVQLIKLLILFYLTSFCFGGAAYYLLYYISPNMVKSINGVLVGSYPIKIAILGGILGFAVLMISFRIIKHKSKQKGLKDLIYDIELIYKEKNIKIKAILDTGNMLTDPITNTPVIIVESNKLKGFLPSIILDNKEKILRLNSFSDELKDRCRLIPFSSIGKENGLIIGFRPDYIKIKNQDYIIKTQAIIGIHDGRISKNGEYSGLLGLNLLNIKAGMGDKNEYNTIT